MKDAIIIALSRENSDLKFIDYDWMLLEAICNDLEVFHEITTLCSANDCFTLNHVLPSINMIIKQLNSKDTLPEADCKLPIIKFRAAMREDLEKRYQDERIEKMLLAATTLDPVHFRKKMFFCGVQRQHRYL